MTTLDLTAHTTVRDLDRPAPVERNGFTRRRSSIGHDDAKRASREWYQ
jgi:hypothetical protein